MAALPDPSIPGRSAAAMLDAAVDRHGALLLYDGLCGLCDRTVQRVLAQDRRGTLAFATLQGRWGEAAQRAFPALVGVDSVVLVDRDGAHVKSDAALRLARYLGGAWRVALLARLVPRRVRDAGYDLVARRRFRLFGRLDACRVPGPSERARFLD